MENDEKNLNIDFKNKKVLIVDDIQEDLKNTKNVLESLNFDTVDVCANGQECIDLIKRGNTYDVIFLDLMMPQKNGQSTINELNKIPDFNTPVIATIADETWYETFKPTGFADHIQKNFESDKVKELLEKVFSTEYSTSKEVQEEPKIEIPKEPVQVESDVKPSSPTEPPKEQPKPKKKFNIVGYFFLMLIVFFVFETIAEVISYFPAEGAFTSKYGQKMIGELFWGASMLVIVLLFGNSYIFTEKKDKLSKSFLLGLPLIVIGSFNLLVNIINMQAVTTHSSFINLLTLLLYCLFIGLTEEFMCRAWLQNEFIERYGKTRKQVIISIILASLVFGMIHISNILVGQSVLDTIIQVIQATAAGMLFGAIYYRSKNIWSVILLHGLWDFAILLGQMDTVKDCTYGTPTAGIIIYNVIGTIAVVLVYILAFIILMRKSKILPLLCKGYEPNEDMKAKDKKLKTILVIASIVGFLIIDVISGIYASTIEKDFEKYSTCYQYNKGKLPIEFETHYPNYKNYIVTREIDLPCDETDDVTGDGEIVKKYEKKTLEFNLKKNYISILTNNEYEHKIAYDSDIDSFYVETYNGYVYIVINVIDEKDNGSIVYYAKLPLDELDDTVEYLNKLEKSLKAYKLPTIYRIGYTTYQSNNNLTPYFIGDYYKFYIDDKDDIVVIEDE